MQHFELLPDPQYVHKVCIHFFAKYNYVFSLQLIKIPLNYLSYRHRPPDPLTPLSNFALAFDFSVQIAF